MIQPTFLAVFLVVLSGITPAAVPPLAAKAEDRESSAAQLFGPGVLSAGEVYRGCFSDGGDTFYFFKKVTPGAEDYRIVVSRRVDGRWSEPERVDLGGEFSDTYPALSTDGRRIVFASYRPVPGDTSPKPNAHLWMAERKGDGWARPVFLETLTKLGHYHSWVEFGPDGALYFRRTTPDWRSNETLVARWNGEGFDAPVPYEAAERWKGWGEGVRVVGGSPGPGGTMVFLDVATRNPKTGKGASDIYVSFKRGDDWTEPQPLRAGVNADGYDVFPFVSPDGKTLYFVRDFKEFYFVPLQQALP